MKILVTGAAGRLGRASRRPLLQAGHQLRIADLPASALEPVEGEVVLSGNLCEPSVMDQALEGIEVVVHWAASLNVPDFNLVLENNHRMLCELYEGARRHAVRRIVYASSNHAFGLYEPGTRLRLDAPYRADTFYGLSKVWGEELGRMYWTKHGIETVALRIGTFMNLPPRNVRELSSWLGLEDLEQLVQLAVEVPGVTFAPVWGISANTRAHYDLTEANVIGYVPRQDAEVFASGLAAEPSTAPGDIASRYQGGRFVTQSWTPEEQRPRRPGPA
ncbi:MAG: NAD(P)-dependent oxidoreductase [Proteobacteria bacterium]|nr:NAD(P)-dependent oxidoreductase [Pseudomonadota bacterium]